MLEYVRVENYRSIGEKQFINFLASSDKSHREIIIKEQDEILPVIPIYGGNATGKTNILKAIKILSEVVNGEIEIENAYDPCKFYSKESTEFEIIFFKNKIKYYYKLIYNKEKIFREALYYYPNGKISKIFDRNNKEYSFGTIFESLLKPYSIEDVENINFLKTISKFLKGKNQFIDDVADFFKNDLVFMGLSNEELSLNRAKEIFHDKNNNEKMKKFIEYFYRHLNVGAQGIRYSSAIDDPIKKDILMKILKNKDLRKKLINSVKNGKDLNIDIEFNDKILNEILFKDDRLDLIYNVKGKEIFIPLSEESKGIQKIFILGTYIADILCNNKILIFDELETGFHPLLARKIIELFLDRTVKAQLLFTTHNTSLLDLNIFRRDQIYFVSRNKDTEFQSRYNSLGAITGVRKSADIEKAYLEGKYCDAPTYKEFSNAEIFGGLECQKTEI